MEVLTEPYAQSGKLVDGTVAEAAALAVEEDETSAGPPSTHQGHGSQGLRSRVPLPFDEGAVQVGQLMEVADDGATGADGSVQRHVVVGVHVAPRRDPGTGLLGRGEAQAASPALEHGDAGSAHAAE